MTGSRAGYVQDMLSKIVCTVALLCEFFKMIWLSALMPSKLNKIGFENLPSYLGCIQPARISVRKTIMQGCDCCVLGVTKKISLNCHEAHDDDKFTHNGNACSSQRDFHNYEVAISNFNQKWRKLSCGTHSAGGGIRRSSSSSSSHGDETKDSSQSRVSLNDFHLLKTIGKGAFGRVVLVQSRITGQFYAMKVMNKKSVVTHNNAKGVVNEKRIMQCVSFPFLVQLHAHFKDSKNLYMVMEFVSGGDLFFHLRRRSCFKEKEAQFYGSQIVLALEYLHTLNVVYRDLKPENILICHDGYIKLTDFGLAKRLSVLGRTRTMLGTPEYLAPEIFLHKSYGKCVDWWAFGILIFEMVHGKSPFRSESDAETYQKILDGKYSFEPTVSITFKHLVTNLLKEDRSVRLGAEGPEAVKAHDWFHGISWGLMLDKAISPPFVPKIVHRGDTRFFDVYTDNVNELRNVGPESLDDPYYSTFADF